MNMYIKSVAEGNLCSGPWGILKQHNYPGLITTWEWILVKRSSQCMWEKLIFRWSWNNTSSNISVSIRNQMNRTALHLKWGHNVSYTALPSKNKKQINDESSVNFNMKTLGYSFCSVFFSPNFLSSLMEANQPAETTKCAREAVLCQPRPLLVSDTPLSAVVVLVARLRSISLPVAWSHLWRIVDTSGLGEYVWSASAVNTTVVTAEVSSTRTPTRPPA